MSNIEIHAGDVASEFPDFPLDTVPALDTVPVLGTELWQDKSWRNDVCPSWVATFWPGAGEERREFLFVLWVDWPDPSQRELPECSRMYLVGYDVTNDPDRDRYYQGDHQFEARGETVEELVEGLADGWADGLADGVLEGSVWTAGSEGVRLYAAAAFAAFRYMKESSDEQ